MTEPNRLSDPQLQASEQRRDYSDEEPVGEKLRRHCERARIPLVGDPNQFALDMGFGNVGDLDVALSQILQ